jgi:pheromone shutdown protein TraB
MAEAAEKQIKVLVIGTGHEYQRHQDTMPDREKVRAEFDKFLGRIIKERNIDLVAEEAGDDTAMWENLKRNDELVGEFAEAFGGSGSRTVDKPVPTIARTIADEYRVKHADVDVDVRAKENDAESIKRRDETMTEKILKVLGTTENVLVIVGDAHRAGVVQRLMGEGLSVECVHFHR